MTGQKKRIQEIVALAVEKGFNIPEKSIKHYAKEKGIEYVLVRLKWESQIIDNISVLLLSCLWLLFKRFVTTFQIIIYNIYNIYNILFILNILIACCYTEVINN